MLPPPLDAFDPAPPPLLDDVVADVMPPAAVAADVAAAFAADADAADAADALAAWAAAAAAADDDDVDVDVTVLAVGPVPVMKRWKMSGHIKRRCRQHCGRAEGDRVVSGR